MMMNEVIVRSRENEMFGSGSNRRDEVEKRDVCT